MQEPKGVNQIALPPKMSFSYDVSTVTNPNMTNWPKEDPGNDTIDSRATETRSFKLLTLVSTIYFATLIIESGVRDCTWHQTSSMAVMATLLSNAQMPVLR